MKRSKCLYGLLLFAVMSPAIAQDQTPTQKLQKEVDDLQSTVKALQAEVQELKAEKTQPAAAVTTTSTSTATSTPPAAVAPTLVPSGQVNALELSDAERSP